MRADIIISAILIATIISGCTQSTETIDCNIIKDRKDADLCFLNQSIRKYDSSGCDNIMTLETKVECIDGIAIKLLDYNACNAHDYRPNQDRCEVKVGEAKRAIR